MYAGADSHSAAARANLLRSDLAAQSALRAPQGGGLTLDRGYDAILACAGGVHSCKME